MNISRDRRQGRGIDRIERIILGRFNFGNLADIEDLDRVVECIGQVLIEIRRDLFIPHQPDLVNTDGPVVQQIGLERSLQLGCPVVGDHLDLFLGHGVLELIQSRRHDVKVFVLVRVVNAQVGLSVGDDHTGVTIVNVIDFVGDVPEIQRSQFDVFKGNTGAVNLAQHGIENVTPDRRQDHPDLVAAERIFAVNVVVFLSVKGGNFLDLRRDDRLEFPLGELGQGQLVNHGVLARNGHKDPGRLDLLLFDQRLDRLTQRTRRQDIEIDLRLARLEDRIAERTGFEIDIPDEVIRYVYPEVFV